MEGRERAGTGGRETSAELGRGRGRQGLPTRGPRGPRWWRVCPPGLGLWAETPPTRPQLRAHGAWVPWLRQLCRRIPLGTPSPPRVFCHQAHSPEPHPSPSARLPQRQGQSPGRCPGVRRTVCLGAEACLGPYCSMPASSPLSLARPAPRSGHFKMLSCSWFSVIGPFLVTGRGCTPPPHVPLTGPCSSSCLQNDWLPFPLPVLCQERFFGKKKET